MLGDKNFNSGQKTYFWFAWVQILDDEASWAAASATISPGNLKQVLNILIGRTRWVVAQVYKQDLIVA